MSRGGCSRPELGWHRSCRSHGSRFDSIDSSPILSSLENGHCYDEIDQSGSVSVPHPSFPLHRCFVKAKMAKSGGLFKKWCLMGVKLHLGPVPFLVHSRGTRMDSKAAAAALFPVLPISARSQVMLRCVLSIANDIGNE
eukprot:gene23937-biopygen2096